MCTRVETLVWYVVVVAVVAVASGHKLQKREDVTTNEVTNQDPELETRRSHPHALLFGGTCGGSIISSTWILTAAHCSISGGYSVVSGEIVRRVKRLVIHPRFTVGPYWVDAEEFGIKQVGARYDFLLAELEEPLPVDDLRSVVLLDEGIPLPHNTSVGFAGYGAERFGETMREVMRGVELRTLPDEECEQRFVEFSREDMLCAVNTRPGEFVCAGDSGSGLVSAGRLVGVASWIEDDARVCRDGATVVFARVSAVRSWIREVTGI